MTIAADWQVILSNQPRIARGGSAKYQLVTA